MANGLINLLHWRNLWQMGVVWVAALVFSYLKILLRRNLRAPAHMSSCSLETKAFPCACIITGGSSGIGKATAEVLALKGYYVILAGRSMIRLCKVIEELELRHNGITMKALEVNLASTNSILKFSEAVKKLLGTGHGSVPLQLLINNAGILAATKRTTLEGYDSMMATNYLGHFLLTQLLLPHMQQSQVPARVVNVGSFTHYCVKSKDGLLSLLQKREMQKDRDLYKGAVYRTPYIYETSKLFMILFAYELQRRLNTGSLEMQITATVADPGVVRTNIFRETPKWFSTLVFACLRCTWLLSSPSDGCKAVVNAALAPPASSGKYFFGGNGLVSASSALSYDKKFAAELWDLTAMLCNEALHKNKVLLEGHHQHP